MVKTYRLYAAITASINAAAQLDITRKGRIVGVNTALVVDGAPTTGDYLRAEVSFSNAAQPTTNDAANIIAEFGFGGFLTTSGAGWLNGNAAAGPLSIPVQVGDRIYLNATEVGASTWRLAILLYVDE